MLTFPLVAILFIAFFGTYEGNVERLNVKFQTHKLQTQGNFSSSTDSAVIKTGQRWKTEIWTRSVTDNILYTLKGKVARLERTTSEALFTVTDWLILLVVLWFYMQVLIKAFGLNWLTLSPLSIAPMALLGSDMYRWGALAVTNMFLVSLVMLKRGVAVHDPEFASPGLLYWGKRLWLLGPFGVRSAIGREGMEDALEALQRYFAG